MISALICVMLSLWQDQDLPAQMTLDKDEEILKKYNLLKQPIPFPRSCTAENIELLRKSVEAKRPHLADEIGDAIFLVPEVMFDGLVLGIRAINSEPSDPQRQTITSKVLSVDISSSSGHLFPEFMTFFEEREIKFFSNFQTSYLYTPDVERGVADVNFNNFMVEQRKVLIDVMKKTYFSKYKFRAEEHIHDTAFYVSEWQGIDFVTLPPIIGAYLYYRGLDKNFTIADTYAHVVIEPIQRFVNHGDVVGALAIEWKPSKGWPVGVIASMGMYNHSPEFEFIGIGTTIGAVQQAVEAKGLKLR